jgi:hypothetical protein
MEVSSKSIQHIVEFNTVSHNMCVFFGRRDRTHTGFGDSTDAEFVYFRKGRPPCRPTFRLAMGPEMIGRMAKEAVPPMKK